MGGLASAVLPPVGLPVGFALPEGVALSQVAWSPPRNTTEVGRVLVREAGPGNYRLTPDGWVQANSNDRFAPGRLRSEVLAFLANVTSSSAAQKESWADAFVANRTLIGTVQAIPAEDGEWQMWEDFEHGVRVTGIDLSRVAPLAGAWESARSQFGGRQVAFGDWFFIFEGPVIERVADGDQLRVDFQDNTIVRLAASSRDPADVVNRTRVLFSTWQLGAASLGTGDVQSGPIC